MLLPSRSSGSEAELLEDAEVNPMAEVVGMVDVVAQQVFGLLSEGERFPIGKNIRAGAGGIISDTTGSGGISGHLMRAEFPFGIGRKRGEEDDFGARFAADASDHPFQVLLELRNGDAANVMIVHAEADQNKIRALVEHFGFQTPQSLHGGIASRRAIHRGNPRARVFALQIVGPSPPKNEFWFCGLPAGSDAVAEGDDLERRA